jgi:hypothetical protein
MRIEELVKKQLQKSIETRKAEINSSNQMPADEEDSVGRSEQKLPPLYLSVCVRVCARVSSCVSRRRLFSLVSSADLFA